MISRRHLVATAASVAALASPRARAQARDIVVGALYPLTGPAAQIGVDARYAIETALAVINGGEPDLKGQLGTPSLGAKLRVEFADHQADPQKGRAEAERLITQDKAVALLGAYHSSVAAVASQVCERYSLPFVAAESSSPSLHRRGLRFFFRPGPHDEMFSAAMFAFLDELGTAKGIRPKNLALFYEDTLFGTDSSNVQRRLIGERGIKLAADIKYRANSASLTSEVQQLKAAGADVILATSYTSDAILFVRTMAELGFRPGSVIAQDAGYIEPAFLDAAGQEAEGIISRGSFSLDLAGSRPALAIVNKLYRERSGKDLTDNTAREFTATLVLADAIGRAGSTDGEKLRDALARTDIPGARTIMPWSAIRFDTTGQNNDASPIMMQYLDRAYRTIWPLDLAKAPTRWPMRG